MHHADGGGRKKLDDIFRVGDRIEVSADIPETPVPRVQVMVDREGGTGQRGAAEWHDIQAHPASLHPFGIPREHVDVRHEMVGQQDGLGPLQMGVTRHDDIDVGLGKVDEDPLQAGQQAEDVSSASRRYMRTSRATWSLRLRPVWTF